MDRLELVNPAQLTTDAKGWAVVLGQSSLSRWRSLARYITPVPIAATTAQPKTSQTPLAIQT